MLFREGMVAVHYSVFSALNPPFPFLGYLLLLTDDALYLTQQLLALCQ